MRVWYRVVLLSLIVLVAGLIVIQAGSDRDPAQPPASVDPGPLDLNTVNPQLAGHYRFAAAHRDEFEQLRCWCGCEQFLDHRNLADCFERRDGRGWEAHAAGCGVCIGEAALAARMIGDGHTTAEIAEAIDTEFGPTATTTPST